MGRPTFNEAASKSAQLLLAMLVSGQNADGTSAAEKRIEDCTVTDTGEIQGSATVAVCPTVTAKFARFKARSDNAGSVYIGLSDATKADGTTDATTGLEMQAGDDTGWIPCTNLNTFYRISDNAGDDLTYMVLA